jgi:hypothetical protein
MTAVAVVVVAAAGLAAIGLTWMAMEDAPSLVYQNLTISPPRTRIGRSASRVRAQTGPAGQGRGTELLGRRRAERRDRISRRFRAGGQRMDPQR